MKKTEYITFRTDQSTKCFLENIAAQKKWTISQLTEEIVKEYVLQYTAQDEKDILE